MQEGREFGTPPKRSEYSVSSGASSSFIRVRFVSRHAFPA
jgi:hypothetical protein